MRHVALLKRPGLVLGAVSLLTLGACGGDNAATNTTLTPLGPTNFATVPPVEETTTTTIANAIPEGTVYTVAAGDYLSKIAAQFGVSMQEIAEYNEWEDGVNHGLFPGDTINIPAGGTPAVDPNADPSVTVVGGLGTTTTTLAATGTVGATYTVEPNDYLGGIASKFDTTIDAIVAANGWGDGAAHVIYPGDVIQLPG